VAIWLGGNRILEAPQSGSVVKVSDMRWKGYAGAVRPSA
jgi:cell wall-associated NlpC family hydrolase